MAHPSVSFSCGFFVPAWAGGSVPPAHLQAISCPPVISFLLSFLWRHFWKLLDPWQPPSPGRAGPADPHRGWAKAGSSWEAALGDRWVMVLPIHSQAPGLCGGPQSERDSRGPCPRGARSPKGQQPFPHQGNPPPELPQQEWSKDPSKEHRAGSRGLWGAPLLLSLGSACRPWLGWRHRTARCPSSKATRGHGGPGLTRMDFLGTGRGPWPQQGGRVEAGGGGSPGTKTDGGASLVREGTGPWPLPFPWLRAGAALMLVGAGLPFIEHIPSARHVGLNY